MDNRIAAEILAAHADKLNQGPVKRADLPYAGYANLPSIGSLLDLAERIQAVLVPVQPDPAFVRQLGQQLVIASSTNHRATTERTRRAVVVGAAVLGSAVSLASAVGVAAYLLRHRGRPHTRAAASPSN